MEEVSRRLSDEASKLKRWRDLKLQEANTRFMAENYVVLRPLFEKLAGSNTWLPSARYDVPY